MKVTISTIPCPKGCGEFHELKGPTTKNGLIKFTGGCPKKFRLKRTEVKHQNTDRRMTIEISAKQLKENHPDIYATVESSIKEYTQQQ